jgi:UPF0716 protein FxsA
MFKLALLFILVPVAELFLLIEMGRHIGLLSTLALIAFTGLLGAWLARRQGLGVWHGFGRRWRQEVCPLTPQPTASSFSLPAPC